MMSTLDLFKYLDPTTSDDSSFLSFSSFSDLTQPRYQQDDYSSPCSFGQVLDYTQESRNRKPYFQSSPTPPFTCSDVGSDFESPQDPFSIISTAFSPISTTSPNNGDFGIFHTPSKAGPSKLSGPGPTHQSHRSTSSSSDWNSPVTPSLTYKSSVDSLATLAPEHDFYLPPSSHLPSPGYGWDDQAFGASSSTSAHNSPPSPSPYRVVSNPSLNINRHPRVIKQIMSMPALKEEEQTGSWFDEFLHDDEAKVDVGDGLAENLDWTLTFPEFSQGNNESTEGTIFQAFTEQETNDIASLSFENVQASQPSSSTIPSYAQVEAPSIVPDLSFSSVDNDDVSHFYQWMNDNPVNMAETTQDMSLNLDMSSTLDMSSASNSAPSTSWGSYPAQTGIAPSAVFQNDMRPATAPDALGIWSDNSSLSVPGPGSMLRR